MGSRWFSAAVVVLWSVSMSWLIASKIVPSILGGQPPGYQDLLTADDTQPSRVCWTIIWNDRPIGTATSAVNRRGDGSAVLLSVVRFESLPVTQLARELLGSLGALVRPQLWGSQDIDVAMRVENRMDFDEFGQLRMFDTDVDVADMEDFLQLHGIVRNNKLKLQVSTDSGLEAPEASPSRVLYRKEMDLPANGLVADSLSPRPRLANLRLGQTWTFQAYRPFPPTQPLQIVQAKVEKEAIVSWDGDLLSTYLVVYRSEAGSGITAARDPFSRLWVRRDGTVLKQEITLSNLRIEFVRMPDRECDQHALSSAT